MIKNLTGTVYIKNAIKYDYCIVETIKSMAPICDKVVCLVCESDDSTLEMLMELQKEVQNLQLISADWDISQGYDRLRALSDECLKYVDTDWRIHIQADEVLHESSYDYIEWIIARSGADAHRIRRYNLFGNFDSQIDPSMPNAPCGHKPFRLARNFIKSTGDDESLAGQAFPSGDDRNLATQIFSPVVDAECIKVFHYGYLRKHKELVEKSLDMQSWFWQNPDGVDSRFIDARKNGNFDPYKFIPKEKLIPIMIDHPKVARDWVRLRRGFYE